MDILLDRTPPHSIDSEEALLSACMINNAVLDEIEELKPEHFYKSANSEIYAAILDLFKNKEPVDLVTVAEQLNKTKKLEQIGGPAYLAMISDSAPVAVNAAAYAKRIIETAKAREMITVASSIIEQGMNCQDVEKYISDSQSKILSIQPSGSTDEFFSMADVMVDTIDRIEAAQTAEFESSMQLGLGILDNFMQVFGSKLIVIAARPGMGKTALAFSIAKYVASQDKAVGILSIEMDKEQFADRMLSSESDINGMRFYVPDQIDKKSMTRLSTAAENLSVLPITINDSPSNIDDIGRRGKALRKMGIELLVIDQLSQVDQERGLKPHEAIGKNCTAIKQLTRELKIPIILLNQLSRKVEDRAGDNRPILSDLAETGKVEQDADMVVFIYREGYYDKKVDPSRTEIILAKNRQGQTGVENRVIFQANRSMFKTIGRDGY